MPFSPYLHFSRAEWAELRNSTPLTLTEADLDELRGLNEEVSLDEVAKIYLPLSRLLNLYVAKSQDLFRVTDTFLGKPAQKVPFVLGVAGSVAAGKSTTARILQALLSRWPNHPRIDLVTTDGFLFPNKLLETRGIMHRKGFPESYDQRRLIAFMAAIKGGRERVEAPVYSHLIYDIVPEESVVVKQPDVLILEGLNVLQQGDSSRLAVSDFFDFSIYVDASERQLEQWYVERFFKLRETAFQDPRSYFRNYAELSTQEAKQVATKLWRDINLVNLRENIAPTLGRASLILAKGEAHAVEEVKLRRL